MIFHCWSTLPKAERLACIGETPLRRKIDGMQGWPPAGFLLKRWEEEIDSKIGKILGDEENQSLVRDSGGLGYTCSHVLLMLSRTRREEAEAFVICYHEEKKKAKGAVKVLKTNKEMERFGFEYLAVKGPLIFTGDGPLEEPHTEHLVWNIDSVCGKHVLACRPPIDSQTQGIRATLGGVLRFGPESYYGLTSAHIFFNLPDRTKQSTSSSEDRGAFESAGKQAESGSGAEIRLHPSNVIPKTPAFHAMFSIGIKDEGYDSEERHLTLKASDQHIGNNNLYHRSTAIDTTRVYNPSLDWTLFEITNPRFWRTNTVKFSQNHSVIPRPGYNRTRAPLGNLIVLSGPSGPREGVGIGMKSNICLPWSGKFVPAWLLDCELGVGSCGSWVIDPESGVICGIIIAGSPQTGLSWMLPADPIFKDVLEKWQDSYEAPQDVFQISRYMPINFEVGEDRGPKETRNHDGGQGSLPRVVLPQLVPSSLAETASPSRPSSMLPTMSEAGRIYEPSVISSDPSNFPKSTDYTVSEPESSMTSDPAHQHQRMEQWTASKTDEKGVLGLPDVAFEFVDKCSNDFGPCYKFMMKHPHVLSVPVESFINAASAAQAKNLGGLVRSCITKAVMLQNYTSRVFVEEVLKEYFEPLINGDQEAVGEFFARRDQLYRQIREQSGSQQ